MSTDGDSITTPLVRGLLAALSVLGIGLAVVVVPALAAQAAGTASSATALDAVLIALNVLVLGHGGGVVLSTGVIDGAVTLTPVGLQILLVLLAPLSLRQVGHRLELVRGDGVPRVVGRAGCGRLPRRLRRDPCDRSRRARRDRPRRRCRADGDLRRRLRGAGRHRRRTDRPAVVAAARAHHGGAGRAGARARCRPPTARSPAPRRWRCWACSAPGCLLVLVLMLTHVPAQSALFDQLDPGIVGGLVLTLLRLALPPPLAVWALVVPLGGTVVVGTSTGISLGEVQTGVSPALPILGAAARAGRPAGSDLGADAGARARRRPRRRLPGAGRGRARAARADHGLDRLPGRGRRRGARCSPGSPPAGSATAAWCTSVPPWEPSSCPCWAWSCSRPGS
ncbi:DUF6350 family protein [Brachybacterium sp. GPGPB12]|uniref:cell division protein PerM n=1 Tax=Brachybacterium sp. GPGPB12 TaxID=3023517 RepID=UPI0031345FBC